MASPRSPLPCAALGLALAVGPTSSLLGCSQRSSSSPTDCQAPSVPELVLGQVTTPTEVDITVTLTPRASPAGLPQAFWQSVAIDRSATSPEGTRWTNDAEVVSSVWVSFEQGPVLHLGMSRTGRKDGGSIFGAPLALHLTFDGKLRSSACATSGTTSHVDLELTLVADSGPLRVEGFRAVERRPGSAR